MPGFTANNTTVHEANSVTGFRNAGKGKRHRWDLKSVAKQKLPAIPKVAPIDSTFGVDDNDGPDNELLNDRDNITAHPIPAVPHHVAVNIHLDPKAHAAFKGLQSRRK
jgi:hypothetical protein